MVGYFGFQYINFLILTWTPKYLQDEYHFEIHSLWYLGMIPWIGACFTAYFGGRLVRLVTCENRQSKNCTIRFSDIWNDFGSDLFFNYPNNQSNWLDNVPNDAR